MMSFWQEQRSAVCRAASLIIILAPACVALAQQPSSASRRAPSLTTEDLLKPQSSQPSSVSPSDATTGKTLVGDGSESPAQQSDESKVSPEEVSWREQVAKARENVKASERAAEEGELRITALRNNLAVSGQTPQYRNETAAELDEAGRQLKELRARARAAAEELAQLLEAGQQSKFSEAPGPSRTLENGNANEDYYASRYVALVETWQAAERRVQLYDNRVRDLGQRILQTGGKKGEKGGDNFYMMQLQQELKEVQQQLDDSRAASAKARTDLDALKEEARRAGVAPGVFR
jgi:hypothetical protein